MQRVLLGGLVAGAAGTMALDVMTYLDMAVRGRASSGVPAQVADKMTSALGIDLSGESNEETGQNRLSGLGALLGYGVGLSAGVLYGAARAAGWRPSTALAGVATGAAVMAATDVPAVAMGVTDPKTWGISGWMSDIVPHLAYGLIVAAVYNRYVE